VFTLNGLQPRRDFNRCMDVPAACFLRRRRSVCTYSLRVQCPDDSLCKKSLKRCLAKQLRFAYALSNCFFCYFTITKLQKIHPSVFSRAFPFLWAGYRPKWGSGYRPGLRDSYELFVFIFLRTCRIRNFYTIIGQI